jgi:hypothetical protein
VDADKSVEQATVPEKTKRADAPSIPTDGDLRRDQLRGKDKDRDYIYADPRVEQFGVADYMAKGYTVEKRRSGGVRPVIESRDAAEGAEIKQMGCVLLSRPKSIGQAEFKAQQSIADSFDRAILKPGGADGLRGVTGYTGFRNTSTQLERDED